jgi:hypothetical protein
MVTGKIPCGHYPGSLIDPLEQLAAKEIFKVIEVLRSYDCKGIHALKAAQL